MLRDEILFGIIPGPILANVHVLVVWFLDILRVCFNMFSSVLALPRTGIVKFAGTGTWWLDEEGPCIIFENFACEPGLPVHQLVFTVHGGQPYSKRFTIWNSVDHRGVNRWMTLTKYADTLPWSNLSCISPPPSPSSSDTESSSDEDSDSSSSESRSVAASWLKVGLQQKKKREKEAKSSGSHSVGASWVKPEEDDFEEV